MVWVSIIQVLEQAGLKIQGTYSPEYLVYLITKIKTIY